jgi:ribosomal protein S1
MDHDYSVEEWNNSNFDNKTLTARVVFVDRANKIVQMSLRADLVAKSQLDGIPELGSTVRDLRIVSADSHEITLKSLEVPKYSFLLPRSKAKEDETYIPGTSLPVAKITGYQLIDGVLLCSNLTSVTENSVIHRSAVRVGEVHEAVVEKIKDFGLILKINNAVHVLCPLQHISDSSFSGKLASHFRTGQQLKVRVWEISKAGIIVTNKKSLVEAAPAQYLESLGSADIGKHCIGIIGNVSPEGISVRFWNKMQGFLSSKVLMAQGFHDALETSRVGQILKVIIIGLDLQSDSHKLYLAIDLNSEKQNLTELYSLISTPQQTHSNRYFVSGKVDKLEDDGLSITLDDGRAAVLEKYQLGDFSDDISHLLHSPKFQVGQRISNALVLREDSKFVYLSLKPLLLFTAHHQEKCQKQNNEPAIRIPGNLAEVAPGLCVAGYITKVEPFGVIIQFRNRLSALVPRPSLSDRFISTPEGIFSVGMSAKCIIQRVDLSKERIFAAFKPSLVPRSLPGFSYLKHFLCETYEKALYNSTEKLFPKWESYRIGGRYRLQLHSKESYGLVFMSEDQGTIFVDSQTPLNKAHQIGKLYNVFVLDINYSNFVVEVLVAEKNVNLASVEKNFPLSKVSCEILSVKQNYLIVQHNGILAYVALSDYHNPKPSTDCYKVSDKVTVFPEAVDAEERCSGFPHAHVNFCLVFSDQKPDQVSHSKSQTAVELSSNATTIYNKLKIGSTARWIIESITELELIVSPTSDFGSNPVRASVHISEFYSDLRMEDYLSKALEDCYHGSTSLKTSLHAQHPFHQFSIGMEIQCTIIHSHHIKVGNADEIQLQLRVLTKNALSLVGNSDFAEENMVTYHHKSQLLPDNVYLAAVTEVNPLSCTVMLSPFIKAELPVSEVSTNLRLLKAFQEKCFVGLKVLVGLLPIQEKRKSHLVASRVMVEKLMDSSKLFVNTSIDLAAVIISYKVGDVVPGILDLRQHNLPNPPAFKICVAGNYVGRASITELVDQNEWADLSQFFKTQVLLPADSPPSLPYKFSHGNVVKCRILSADGHSLNVSLRPSCLVIELHMP